MTEVKSTAGGLPKGVSPVEAAKNLLKKEHVKYVLCAFTDIRGIFQSFLQQAVKVICFRESSTRGLAKME